LDDRHRAFSGLLLMMICMASCLPSTHHDGFSATGLSGILNRSKHDFLPDRVGVTRGRGSRPPEARRSTLTLGKFLTSHAVGENPRWSSDFNDLNAGALPSAFAALTG
jgi:hypothetical protein